MTAVIFTFLLLFALTTLVISLGFKFLETQRRKKVTEMLEVATGRAAMPETKVLIDSAPPAGFSRLLAGLNLGRRLEAQIQQAGLNWKLSALLAQMALAAALGAFIGVMTRLLISPWTSALALGALLGLLPYLYVVRKRRRRLDSFEEQFPDALDFLARAMRAGHAFSISLEMISNEAPPPLNVEFRKVYNEQNLGLPIETALNNLASRVPLLDVRFFVSSVLLQRETGGNLSEILTKLARIIRERFQLKGQVRAASAHGRITGAILTIMPVMLALGLLIVAPGYLQGMAADEDGKYLIIGAIVGLALGHFTIRRIIDIKV